MIYLSFLIGGIKSLVCTSPNTVHLPLHPTHPTHTRAQVHTTLHLGGMQALVLNGVTEALIIWRYLQYLHHN